MSVVSCIQVRTVMLLNSAWQETRTGCPSILSLILFHPVFSWNAFENWTNSARLSRNPKLKVTFTPSNPPTVSSGLPRGGWLWVFTHICVKTSQNLSAAPASFSCRSNLLLEREMGGKIPLAGKVLDLSSLIMMICFLLLDVCTPGQTHMII